MLRTILTTLIAVACIATASAQSPIQLEPAKNIPLAVKEAFEKEFAGKDPVWYQYYRGSADQKLRFEARFMLDNRYTNASFDEVGRLMALAVTIDQSEIPEDARNYMKQQYPTIPINEALMVQRKSEKTYELGAYLDGVYNVFVFTDKGVFVRNTKV